MSHTLTPMYGPAVRCKIEIEFSDLVLRQYNGVWSAGQRSSVPWGDWPGRAVAGAGGAEADSVGHLICCILVAWMPAPSVTYWNQTGTGCNKHAT